MRHIPILLALAAVACARGPKPQVLSPVRIDPTSIPDAARDVRQVERDPFFGRDEIAWPGPNQYRSAQGSPGPGYWQQRADYTIAAVLDTAQQRVSGAVTIRYTNNSPDALRAVWLQLEQNLYRPGSKGSVLYPSESRWGVRGFEGGFDLTNVAANGSPSHFHVDDTVMRLDLDTPLAPRGGKLTITMNFAFRVPVHGSDRMGRDGTLYEIAQWYPRMAVYDDVRGWNAEPYLGQGEFYLEYGDFEYAITAPAGYVIAGSGVLQNPHDWAHGDRFDAAVDVACRVAGVRLWPEGFVPDWNPNNDAWGNAPEPARAGPVAVPDE